MRGTEWIIDAHGCEPAALVDVTRLRGLFDALVEALSLTPVGDPAWHTFPPPGGVTGFVVLAESHLACHTFPEFGAICVNVFCCRPRPPLDVAPLLARLKETEVPKELRPIIEARIRKNAAATSKR